MVVGIVLCDHCCYLGCLETLLEIHAVQMKVEKRGKCIIFKCFFFLKIHIFIKMLTNLIVKSAMFLLRVYVNSS